MSMGLDRYVQVWISLFNCGECSDLSHIEPLPLIWRLHDVRCTAFEDAASASWWLASPVSQEHFHVRSEAKFKLAMNSISTSMNSIFVWSGHIFYRLYIYIHGTAHVYFESLFPRPPSPFPASRVRVNYDQLCCRVHYLLRHLLTNTACLLPAG